MEHVKDSICHCCLLRWKKGGCKLRNLVALRSWEHPLFYIVQINMDISPITTREGNLPTTQMSEEIASLLDHPEMNVAILMP